MLIRNQYWVMIVVVALVSLSAYTLLTGLTVSEDGKIGTPEGPSFPIKKITVPMPIPPDMEDDTVKPSKIKTPRSSTRSKALDIPSAGGLSVLTQATNVSTCQTINSSGAYVLNTNLSSSGTCLTITANNVTIDCDGFNIDGTDTGNSRGIYLNSVDDTTVKNCIITDYEEAIYMNFADNNLIINNNFSSNTDAGIQSLNAGDNNVFRNNTFSDSWIGISFSTATHDNNTIVNNSISATSLGISISGAGHTIENNTIFSGASIQIHNSTFNNNNLSSNAAFAGDNNTILYNVLSGGGISLNSASDNNNISYNNVSFSSTGISSSGKYNFLSNNRVLNGTFANGIRLGDNDIAINNTILGGAQTGMWVENVDNTTVKNNFVKDMTFQGIVIQSTANNNTIVNNTVINTGDRGIRVWGAYNNTIINNNVTGGDDYGFHIEDADNNSFLNNTVTNNGDGQFNNAGIYLTNSVGNNLSNNIFNFNDNDGIFLSNSDNNTLINNTANSNADYGIKISSSDNTILINNAAKDNSIYEFRSQSSSLNNVVINLTTNDTISSFNHSGSFLNIKDADGTGRPAPPGFATISHFVDFSAAGTLYLNISYEDTDIPAGFNESTMQIYKNTSGGWNTNLGHPVINEVNEIDNYVFARITSFGSVFAPLVAEIPVTFGPNQTSVDRCGTLLGSGVTYTLNQSINNTAGDCIIFGNESITFNCSGFDIVGTGTADVGVNVTNYDDAIVKNCNITGHTVGIDMRFSNNNTVINNTLNSNGFGFYSSALTNSSVTDNTASFNTQTGGIRIGGTNNTLINNTANFNIPTGFELNSDTTFINNTANANFYGVSLVFADDSILINNNIESSITTGISLIASDGVLFTDNTIENNTLGVSLTSASDNNNFTDNIINFSDTQGIEVLYSNMNYFIDNNISFNGEDGILLTSSDENTLGGNIISYNSNNGISISASENNTLQNNTIGSNSVYGVNITESSGHVVIDNFISNSTQAIYLQSNNLTTIYNNTLSANDEGILFDAVSLPGLGTCPSGCPSVCNPPFCPLGCPTGSPACIPPACPLGCPTPCYPPFCDPGCPTPECCPPGCSPPLECVSACLLTPSSGEFIPSIGNNISQNIIQDTLGIGLTLFHINDSILVGNSLTNNTPWDFVTVNATNVTIINLTVNETTSSFTFSGDLNISGNIVGNVSEPTDFELLPEYLNITNNTPGAWVYINVSYDDVDVVESDESQIQIYKNLGGDNWTNETGGINSVDTIANYAYANISNFSSIFSPMGPVPQRVVFGPLDTSVDSCGNLTGGGLTYFLTQDLSANLLDDCITVDNDSITLDCLGYNMTGPSTKSGIDITDVDDVVIKNCIIEGFSFGIKLSNADNGTLFNNTLIDNTLRNIDLIGGSNNNNVSNNIARESINMGIRVVSDNNTIEYNTIFDNNIGISVLSDYNTINYNNVILNDHDPAFSKGIYLSGADYNIITGNTASFNKLAGIQLINSWNNSLINNTANYNNGLISFPTKQGVGDGIFLSSSGNNTLTDNTAQNNVDEQFVSTSSSEGNVVNNLLINDSNVSFTYSGDVAVSDSDGTNRPDPSGLFNISQYVDVTNSSLAWIFLNVSYSDLDVIGIDEASLIIYKNTSGGWNTNLGTSTNGVNQDSNYVYANISNFGSVFAPFGVEAAPTPLSIPFSDTFGGTYGGLAQGVSVTPYEDSLRIIFESSPGGQSLEIPNGAYWGTDLRVNSIEFTNAIDKRILFIEETDNLSFAAPSDVIYKLFSFETDLNNEEIETVYYGYRAIEDWIKESDVDMLSVKVYGYDNGWALLDSSIIGPGSDGYIYYQAKDDRLYEYYAIAEGELGYVDIISSLDMYYSEKIELLDLLNIISEYYQ